MNILIIGFGKIGQIRHNICLKSNLVKHIYIYDPNFKKKLVFGSKTKKINNLSDLKKLEIKAAFVCSPTYLSTSFCKFLIKKDIHVFCEKPPSINVKNLINLKRTLKVKKKINLMYGFNHRHHESIQKIHQIIKEKKYGNILWIRGRYGKPVDDNYISGWRGNYKYSGGGILIDQGIHLLDILILFMGKISEIKSILSNNYIKKKIEDNAFVIFKNTKNQTASLHSTLTQWRHLFSLEIFLQKGYIVLNGLKTPSNSYGDEILSYCKNIKRPPKIKWSKIKTKKYKIDNSFNLETNYFLKKISKNKIIKICNIDEAIYLMRVILKIYSQNKTVF